ncbi:Valine--tRNA ligase [bioreactor metagenome]|uniref:Valine--tRNA ligase n=1 Tax=bioreactor metagenome TaxID=1076179 RepID=A0A645EB91_9ZZZZ
MIRDFETSKEIISGVRNYRQSKGISPRESVDVFTNSTSFANEDLVKKLANISEIYFGQKTDKPSFTFLVGATEVSIPLSENIDLAEEKDKTEKELQHLKGFLISVEKKLSNEKFMAGAPQNVVDTELKKQKDAQEKIALLEKN